MTNRILDLSERPAWLSVRNGLLVLRMAAADPAAPGAGAEEHAMPFEEVAVIVAAHPQTSLSLAVLSGLASGGGILVACDAKRMPAAMMLPLSSHFLQTERFRRQAALPGPARKRLWQQIVREKIAAQARLLEQRAGTDRGLMAIAARVRSGDPENVEARASRVYWQNLFAEGDQFRRRPEGEGLNPHLNYGYAVLRAATARAICAAGLHPSFGLHHHNRYDAFCLADDLMEPYRPLVSRY